MRYIITTALLLASLLIFSQTITVKQDGSGNYTSIQEAIDNAVDGDVVLVWPGTYYENISYEGKNITLASLNYTTGDPAYIDSTIINGNQSGSCVRLNNDETDCYLQGFTITNGSGTWLYDNMYFGGGLYLLNSTLRIANCNIFKNSATGSGGGIFCYNVVLNLSGCNIIYNSTYHIGGGISVIGFSELAFDEKNLCSMYLNNACWGTDIHKSDIVAPIHVIVDTFTITSPNQYFLSSVDIYGYQIEGITYSINHGKIDQVNDDLFVSPLGSDDNNGLSPQTPLKTLAYALKKVVPDSTKANTIYLENGIYSPSLTGEKFPLNLRTYVNIMGESKDSCILDADSLTWFFRPYNRTHNYKIENLTLISGNGNTYSSLGIGIADLFDNYNIEFNNVKFTQSIGEIYSALIINTCNNVVFNNCDFFDNYGGNAAIGTGTSYLPGMTVDHDTVSFVNCRIYDNKANPNPLHSIDYGGGIDIDGLEQSENSITVYMINCQVTDHRMMYFSPTSIYDCGIVVFDAAELFLVNSTVGNNSSEYTQYSAPVCASMGGSIYAYNSIFFGNEPFQFSLSGSSGNTHSTLEIYNSLVQYGEQGVHQSGTGHIFHYDVSNMETDPMWDTLNIFPYCLSPGSPCIDYGTLNLPAGIELPETDLAGNPRIYGNGVDLGAYEYGPWVGEHELQPINLDSYSEVLVYPNPTSDLVHFDFRFLIPDSRLSIYNVDGISIEKMNLTKGQNKLTIDISNYKKGMYYFTIISEEKIIGNGKIIKL